MFWRVDSLQVVRKVGDGERYCQVRKFQFYKRNFFVVD